MKLRSYQTLGALAVTAIIGMGSAAALEVPLTKGALNKKVVSARERLDAFQAKPAQAIPAGVLKGARGIVIMRELKVGLGIGGGAGGGVAMVKAAGSEKWSAPAFVRAAEASTGAQIGAQDNDVIIVLMSEKSLGFLKPLGSTEAGFEAKAVAGPIGLGATIDTDTLKSNILVYTDSSGAYAGATIKGGAIVGAPARNKFYHDANMQDVLFGGKGATTPEGTALAAAIDRYASAKAAKE